MKEVIERLNWLAYKCEDKAITPDVKDDVKYALEEIERLNENNQAYQKELCKVWAERDNAYRIINELEKLLKEEKTRTRYANDVERFTAYDFALDKLQELKESNEPSFEEMVNFVENVCKDIKSQSTLDEELREERERIAKIVDDFKEVISNE